MSDTHLSEQQIALQIAEGLREIATRQGVVPFDTGDLRKAHRVSPWGRRGALLSADTPYARAVHDGRPALVIAPRTKRALYWRGARHPVRQVRQPARAGRPWLRQSIRLLDAEGLAWLEPQIGPALVADLEAMIRRNPYLRVT